MSKLEEFLYPQATYRGDCHPEVNEEMQEFASIVQFQVNLETSGKISCEQAYKTIKAAYKRLKKAKKKCKGETDD